MVCTMPVTKNRPFRPLGGLAPLANELTNHIAGEFRAKGFLNVGTNLHLLSPACGAEIFDSSYLITKSEQNITQSTRIATGAYAPAYCTYTILQLSRLRVLFMQFFLEKWLFRASCVVLLCLSVVCCCCLAFLSISYSDCSCVHGEAIMKLYNSQGWASGLLFLCMCCLRLVRWVSSVFSMYVVQVYSA